jgi:hypothetical protein
MVETRVSAAGLAEFLMQLTGWRLSFLYRISVASLVARSGSAMRCVIDLQNGRKQLD